MLNFARKFGDRAVLRALHFMDCNDRVDQESEALENNNFDEFLSIVNQSGDSSYKYLQNIFASSSPKEQGLASSLCTYLRIFSVDREPAECTEVVLPALFRHLFQTKCFRNLSQKLKLYLVKVHVMYWT